MGLGRQFKTKKAKTRPFVLRCVFVHSAQIFSRKLFRPPSVHRLTFVQRGRYCDNKILVIYMEC